MLSNRYKKSIADVDSRTSPQGDALRTSGLYTLTYTATDIAGNSSSVSRVITVVVTSAPQQ